VRFVGLDLARSPGTQAALPSLDWDELSLARCLDDVLTAEAAILDFLAGYQIVEVGVCSLGPGHGFLPRLAFLVVTWRPPLGILVVSFLLSPSAGVARRFSACR